jgi:hypothetical protein
MVSSDEFIYFSRQPLGEGMENFLGDLLDEKNELI